MVDDPLERDFVRDGEIGKDLAIEPDIRCFQSFGEAAVGQPLRPDGSVEPLDPEITESAFAGFAVAIRPILGLHRRVFRVTEKFGTAAAETLGPVEDAFAALPAGGSISCSWHIVLSSPRAGSFVQRIVIYLGSARPHSLIRRRIKRRQVGKSANTLWRSRVGKVARRQVDATS